MKNISWKQTALLHNPERKGETIEMEIQRESCREEFSYLGQMQAANWSKDPFPLGLKHVANDMLLPESC